MSRGVRASGYAVLFAGVALLAVTFLMAYLQLQEIADIPVAGDLMSVFGEALAPLIETCIRAIYLGIMGWVGSILTRRGVQVLTSPREGKEAKLEVAPEVGGGKPPTPSKKPSKSRR